LFRPLPARIENPHHAAASKFFEFFLNNPAIYGVYINERSNFCQSCARFSPEQTKSAKNEEITEYCLDIELLLW